MSKKTQLPAYCCLQHVDEDLPDNAEIAFASGYTGEGRFVGNGHQCQHENCDRIAKYYLRVKP